MVTERELATILAALRLWQGGPRHDLMNIATNDGEFVQLSGAEIDVLAERLNFEGSE
ncbi:hypothetical protein LCGC14_2371380 [marine sediment metagenome]|uniref:Uncharacterized protein n=1 Tax=marine sediment metagenome TaxID=412755 RepID=A0A0F9EYC5_9ZZZZ